MAARVWLGQLRSVRFLSVTHESKNPLIVMSKHSFDSEPSDNTTLVSALGWIGVFLVFVLVVALTYLRDPASTQETINTVERIKIRNEVEADQARLVNNYQWVNEPEGVIRVPVERAMELVVEELKAEQEAGS